MKNLKLMSVLLIAAFVVAGCSSTKTAKKSGKRGTDVASSDASGKDSDVKEVNIRGGEFGKTPKLSTILFEYDRYALSEDARTKLARNAEYLKKNKEFEVLVEGSCDERGTVEYNLALGQKRAQTVRDYYTRLGVPAKQVGTLSYGKEKPNCQEATEECWAKNRRADTKVRSRTVSTPRSHPEEEDQK